MWGRVYGAQGRYADQVPPPRAVPEGVERAKHTFNLLLEWSVPLVAGVIAALAWANLAPESYHHLVHHPLVGDGHYTSLHFLINDVFMALFFGIAAGEITESCLPGGALNPPRKAINPLLGTIGGIAGPVAVYLAYAAFVGDESIVRGWGIVTATDIAIAWLVARLALGPKHPGVTFLLLLAVADDGIGLGIIAVFYPDPVHPVQPAFLGLVALAAVGAWALRKRQVQSFWPYLLGPGILSWWGLHGAHLHPALALVPVIPFMPAMAHDEGMFADESHHLDTLNRFQHGFKRPVDLGLFAFGLVNAGVMVDSVGSATVAVLLALLVGKTLGITLMGLLGRALGFPLPEGMDTKSLVVVGVCAAVGLTVALFVANVAFADPALQGAAKMGALLSVVAGPLAIAISRALGVRQGEVASRPLAVETAEEPPPVSVRPIPSIAP